jgi:chromosome segregation ATPase
MNNNINETNSNGEKNIVHNNTNASGKTEELQKKMQQELDDLEQKYGKISEQIQNLQNDKSDLKNSMKTMNDSFQQVSKNVEDILSKLDNINVPNKDLNDENEVKRTMDFSMKKMIFSPLRKLVVGTISSVLSVKDKTAEVTCGFKEGFEDIVAEAQYQRTKKHMAAVDES